MSTVLTKKEGSLLILTLNRPEVLNAFNLDLINNLVSELKKADVDPEVKIIIITGEGKAFSAGGDLKAMHDKTDMFAGDEKELEKLYKEGIQQIPQTLDKMKKITIAMVNGAAVGAGCDLACMCDLRIVSDKAFFKESFINLGILSGDGGSFFLQRLIGYGRAMDLLLTGRKVSATEAKEIGLVNYVSDSSKLLEETKDLALKLSRFPTESLQLNKAALQNSLQQGLTEHLNYVAELQARLQRSPEHEDLVNHFFQKS